MRKVISVFGNVGLIFLLVGVFNYSVTSLWDWKSQVGVFGGAALILVYLVFNFSEVRSILSSRSARLGGMALATLILVIGILSLANFLNFRHHKRLDLTEGQMHALSDQTRRVLESLDQSIDIVAFYQDEAGGQRFQDLAGEYRYLSSRLNYEVVDPQKDPSRVSQYQVQRNGQVVVVGANKREIIDDPDEEKLTNAIIKVTREGEKKIYFLTGHGERSLDDFEGTGYSTVKQEIQKQNYQVESLNLAQENAIPEDAAVLVSAGPKVNFFPNEVQLLQSYLASGGKLFLLVDPETEFEMNTFLAQYGLELSNDFVVDASGLGQLFGFGAAAPLAADYTSHPITRDFEGTMTIYPAARSVRTVDSSLGYTSSELVRTSAQSWGESDIAGETVSFNEERDRKGPVPIAAVSTKALATESALDEGESPEDTEELPSGETDEDAPSADFEVDAPEEAEAGPSGESRIVIFGDSDFATNALFQTSVNGDLFLNSVSWLAEDTDLLSIRPKDPQNRSVTLTATENRLIFWATVVLFPLATLVFGMAVWYRRR